MKKILIIVDMQNDFVTGSLGSPEAEAAAKRTAEKIRGYDGDILYTMDTHDAEYLHTQEGKYLPVVHCVQGTLGWELYPAVKDALSEKNALNKAFLKHTFGSRQLADYLQEVESLDEVELAGLCTDICVVSNALMIKACLPEMKVKVDAKCCAGATPEGHEAALVTMRSCQIDIAE